MKKFFITFLVLTFTASVFAQQVSRERVVVEVATGTWCPWCVGAAMGVEDLVANGHNIAAIEYHSGDAFSNTHTTARISYYGIIYFPTTYFDGTLFIEGGSASSMYNDFLPLYNQRIAIPCDYTAAIYGHNTDLNYTISVVVDLENGTPPANLTAHLVLTESEIVYSWQGMSELNYVCRDMYPDHLGTTVNFAGGDQVIINYNFTIDASWNTQHVELVAFLQDESTKEILQGTMVPIENIMPLAATANFSCNNQQPCETTSVDFIDESLGLITSWDWTFEGGTPSSSTAQNPTVTYNTPGFFDVQLIVGDGTTTSTLLIEDYIDVITTPAQADIPSGPTDICGGGTGYNYNTNSVPGAVSYFWSINPSSAGTIIGTSTIATLDVNSSYNGTIDITVRAVNQCGDGIWSDAFQTTVHLTPAPFWVSEGSSYCVGTQGVEITLDGSETDVDYELHLDGTPTGIIEAGTGSALNFGYQTGDGIYTIVGYTDYCNLNMYGTAYIYPIDIPGQAATPNGDDAVCIGETTDYSTGGAVDAESYIWTLDPMEAGTIAGSTVAASVEWSTTYTGIAAITVQGVNQCGDGIVSDAFEVSVNTLPEPEISGDELVCENTPGYVYSSPDHAQANYTWVVTGGTITDGQGTHEITITWGDMGAGSVNLTELSVAGCEGIATEFSVTIDECVRINESFMNEISLYPNPAGGSLNIELFSQKDASITIQVLNQVGQTVISRNAELTSGNNKSTLNTSDLRNGYYTLKLIAEDGTIVQEKFIIMK
ncbi:MAG: T9SS type A sorting domain-containing protein [Bacteroidales bacterium]|nr:T9SS type A sorting domain-containing protein [Bacteroidales bacterium]